MFDVLLFDGHMVVPAGESLALVYSRVHPVEWFGYGDDGSAKLSSAIGHWMLVKLELSR